MDNIDFFNQRIRILYLEKFSYKHPKEIPNLNKIDFKFDIKNGKTTLPALVALRLITNTKPVLQKETKNKNKSLKPKITGCSTSLIKKDLNDFFNKFLHIYLPQIQFFKGLNPNKTNNLYSCNIEDISIFTELESEFEHFLLLKNLKIDFLLSNNNIIENLFFFKIHNILIK